MTWLILFFSILSIQHYTVEPIIDIAVDNCKNVTPNRVEEARRIAHMIYMVERLFDVPEELKGMTLAAACLESGFNPSAQGDRKFSKDKKTPKAIGIMQLWSWWEKGKYGYQIDRRDPVQSVFAWMTHIKKQLPKVKKRCRPRSEKKAWIQAWVHAVRAPKPTGRCREKPKHLRYLLKIQRVYGEMQNTRMKTPNNVKHN